MESYLFREVEADADALVVEGYHKPGSLTRASGAWIHAAGSAMLEPRTYRLVPHPQWVWLAVEEGEVELGWQDCVLNLKPEQTCFLPAGDVAAQVSCTAQARLVWIALEGPLAPMVVRKMGALLHMPLKQGALPSQM